MSRTTSDAGQVDRVVLDLRHNGGGNNALYRPLLTFLQNPLVNRPGGLYVVTGRVTFSAAGNLVTDLDATTEAVIVGEPMGAAPNQYGDSMPVPLEHSGLVLRIAPNYIQRSTPDDPRLTIEPELPAPLASTDYFGDRDPAMTAILAAA